MAWVPPRTWGTSETLTAAKMNEISASLDVVGGTTWQTYTPTWGGATNPTLGNGSIAGWYLEAAGWCDVEFVLTIGSSTTVGTGSYTISIPVAAASAATVAMGSGLVFDASAATPNNLFSQTVYRSSVNTLVALTGAGGRWTAAHPTVPATGDIISGRFKYRI
jgi:hypothetical protein